MKTPQQPTRTCTNCHKLEDPSSPFKHCAACPSTLYCTPSCQKAHWKEHKPSCASRQQQNQQQSQSSSAGASHNPGFNTMNQLLGLSNDDYLHKLSSKTEVFGQLIDCFRMRVEDEYVFAHGNVGIYAGEDPRVPFGEFLDLAESRRGLLPGWWNAEKRKECESMAVDASQWSDINCAVEKGDVQDHYGDSTMPMKLRILGEKVYGKGFM